MPNDNQFSVNFASGRKISLDEMRKRKSVFMPDNRHAWVISTIFALDDPEQALDEMVLDDKNFVGVAGIQCLLCGDTYRSTNRFHECPQAPPT